MWFKKWLLGRSLKRITKGEEVKLHTPNRLQTIELLQLLTMEQFEIYHPRIGLRTEMRMLHKTLEEFVINLQELEYKLKTRNFITQDDVTTERFATNVDHYFVTKAGYMVELSEGVLHFKHYALSICTFLQRQQGETLAHYEHNERMLTHVLADMQVLTRTLLSIAYQKGA